MQFNLEDIAAITEGTLVGARKGAAGVHVTNVGIDSRIILPGGLFVPIRADRDGHEFIEDALRHGAAAHLTEGPTFGAPAVEVADTRVALQRLGAGARSRLGALVIGVTGSVGKTTVKEMLRGALEPMGTVSASPGSFNNELGVPLTLANAETDAAVIVVEMGSRGPGQIRLLCEIALPMVGIVTEVAGAHLELFGTLDDVARAKQEIVEGLPPARNGGLAVLNADNARVAAMAAATEARVVTFGREAAADVTADAISVDEEVCASFRLRSPWGDARVTLNIPGRHQVSNALAAAAVGLASGLDPDRVAAGLGLIRAPEGRMQLTRTPSGALIINDAYNANPTSMLAALQALIEVPALRRIAIVGVMAELGETEAAGHRAVAEAAAELGIELFPVDTELYGIEPVPRSELAARLGAIDGSCAVLVKASRVAALEDVIASLV